MSQDRFGETSFKRDLPKVNPFREIPNELRLQVASQIGELYLSSKLPAAESHPTSAEEFSLRSWSELLNKGSLSQNARLGVARMHDLLETHRKSRTDTPQDKEGSSPLPPSLDLLLDLFQQDPRIITSNPPDRLREVYTQIALDLFGPRAFLNPNNPQPENDRVRSIELFFTHEPLANAVEFFLIEPSLLPSVPNHPQDEK